MRKRIRLVHHLFMSKPISKQGCSLEISIYKGSCGCFEFKESYKGWYDCEHWNIIMQIGRCCSFAALFRHIHKIEKELLREIFNKFLALIFPFMTLVFWNIYKQICGPKARAKIVKDIFPLLMNRTDTKYYSGYVCHRTVDILLKVGIRYLGSNSKIW